MKEGYKYYILTHHYGYWSDFSTSKCVAPRIYRSPLLAWSLSSGRHISCSLSKQTAQSCPWKTGIWKDTWGVSLSLYFSLPQSFDILVRRCSETNSSYLNSNLCHSNILQNKSKSFPSTHRRQTLAWSIQLAEAECKRGPTSTSQNKQQRHRLSNLWHLNSRSSSTSTCSSADESLSICAQGHQFCTNKYWIFPIYISHLHAVKGEKNCHSKWILLSQSCEFLTQLNAFEVLYFYWNK